MKISEAENSLIELISRYNINKENVNSKPEKQATGVVLEEKVSLSSMARDIQQAAKAIEELPEIREEKVRELQEQIETGRYNVSGEKIAEKMISESILDVVV
ncbi:MAG: flagellar biosynthesis anti-sigma factor FlgM [Desulfobacterales bacterium]|nr:flagellar biosynthesis anti-sigma factor FlgM [Desulfobacterales bacterium]